MSQQPMRPKAEWAIDSEAMRARGIIVLVKSNQLVKMMKLMNEALFNLGLDEVDQTSSKEKYANKPREIKKRKSKNYLQNKTYKTQLYTIKKPNYSKEYRYYIELTKILAV